MVVMVREHRLVSTECLRQSLHELERVPDPAIWPGPEESSIPYSTLAQILAKPANFYAGLTGLEITLAIKGSSKANRVSRARQA